MRVLLTVLVFILEAMFVVGMIGSAAVILLTMVEDAEVMFERDSAPAAGEKLT